MPNACFRCKSAIQSGETFCGNCRQTVSLDLSYTRNSRLWVILAAVPILQVLIFLVPALWGVVTGAGSGASLLLGSFASFPLAIAFSYVLYRDFQHVRRRDDTDWEPSKWLYMAFAAASILIFVSPLLIAPYHLYKRKRAIGLHLSRSG